MTKKKIIFLSGAIPPKTGGELYNYKISEYLRENEQETGIEHKYVSLQPYRHLLKLGWVPFIGDLIVSLTLAIALYPHKGILVEDHYFSRYLFVTNFIQKVFRKEAIITIVHLFYAYDSFDPLIIRRWFNALIEELRLNFSDIIITSSDYSKREVLSLEICPDKVHAIYPGIDRERFSTLPKSVDDVHKKILCVANYIPRKGILYLIDAFAQLEQKEFKLHLVGNPKNSGSYYRKMRARINELDIEDDVEFHDGADQEQINYLYSTSDIFVLPSLKETFGIVLIEAMHYQLPIITTNSTAMSDLVKDGVNGLLVPPQNSQAIAQALAHLISQPQLRKQMGDRGYQIVQNSYNWDETASKFLSIVQDINGKPIHGKHLSSAQTSH